MTHSLKEMTYIQWESTELVSHVTSQETDMNTGAELFVFLFLFFSIIPLYFVRDPRPWHDAILIQNKFSLPN